MPSPLAARILKQLTMPVADRRLYDSGRVANKLHGVRFFEVTDIVPVAEALSERFEVENAKAPLSAFLPAQKTWIEILDAKSGQRFAILFESRSENRTGDFSAAFERNDGNIIIGTGGTFHFGVGDKPVMAFENIPEFNRPNSTSLDKGFAALIPAILCLINSPRIVSTTAHPAHKSLVKAAAHGHWPLPVWNEIKINIDRRVHQEPNVGGSLTGPRALHWVRRHLRALQDGRIVPVSEHYRGDVRLGFVQSRYKATTDQAVAQ